MKRANHPNQSRSSPTRAGLLLLVLVVVAATRCECEVDPDEVSVDPECPDGKAAAAQLTINGNLDNVRPVDGTKQIRVRGTRSSSASLCFQDGAQLSFSETVEGDGAVSVSLPPLAHGQWELTVIPLSGGDHPEIPPLTHDLTPGGSFFVTLGTVRGGDLTANITGS